MFFDVSKYILSGKLQLFFRYALLPIFISSYPGNSSYYCMHMSVHGLTIIIIVRLFGSFYCEIHIYIHILTRILGEHPADWFLFSTFWKKPSYKFNFDLRYRCFLSFLLFFFNFSPMKTALKSRFFFKFEEILNRPLKEVISKN